MQILAIAGLAAIFSGASQDARLSSAEIQAVSQVKQIGGNFAWVKENGRDTFCLDIDNKGRKLDCNVLSGLKSLQVLRIFQGSLQTDSIDALSKLTKLELLVILCDGLSDRGMRPIGKLRSLNKLDIKCNQLSEKGLRELESLRGLRRLFLYNTTLKDADIGPLKRLTWLEELCLPTTVSDQAISSMRAGLPRTSVRKF